MSPACVSASEPCLSTEASEGKAQGTGTADPQETHLRCLATRTPPPVLRGDRDAFLKLYRKAECEHSSVPANPKRIKPRPVTCSHTSKKPPATPLLQTVQTGLLPKTSLLLAPPANPVGGPWNKWRAKGEESRVLELCEARCALNLSGLQMPPLPPLHKGTHELRLNQI